MLTQLKKSNSKSSLFNKEKKEIMGALFDHSGNRAPEVPPPIKGSNQEYMASVNAWNSQAKRVKNCATSIDLLYKDITRLNLLLRFLKSPNTDLVVKARLFTCIDIESKLSKLLWKFNNNTVIRCDLVHVHSLPPLSDKERKELSQPSHPHQTPGFKPLPNEKKDADDVQLHEEAKQNQQAPQIAPRIAHKSAEKTEAKIASSHVLSVHEFYYLFLFLEDKLPELASWLMSQSNHNQNNLLLRALSAKKQLSLLHKDEQAANPLIEEEDNNDSNNAQHVQEDEEEEEEEKKEDPELAEQAAAEQNANGMNLLQRNEIEDDCCIICFEKMSNPVCLSCGHEYCKECIDDWQSQIGSGKECPVCRCMIEQSQMWVKLDSEDFSKVSYMMELLDFPVAYISKFASWQDTMI